MIHSELEFQIEDHEEDEEEAIQQVNEMIRTNDSMKIRSNNEKVTITTSRNSVNMVKRDSIDKNKLFE